MTQRELEVGTYMQDMNFQTSKWERMFEVRGKRLTSKGSAYSEFLSLKFGELEAHTLNGDDELAIHAAILFVEIAAPIIFNSKKVISLQNFVLAKRYYAAAQKYATVKPVLSVYSPTLSHSGYSELNKDETAAKAKFIGAKRKRLLKQALLSGKLAVDESIMRLLELDIFVLSSAQEILKGTGLEDETLGYRLPKKNPALVPRGKEEAPAQQPVQLIVQQAEKKEEGEDEV